MQVMQHDLLYIHFDRDCHCGPVTYKEWHVEFQQAMIVRTRDGPTAAPPWGGPPIKPNFVSAMVAGVHDCPTSSAFVAGDMTNPLVESAWPNFSAWWCSWWQRQIAAD